MLEYDQCIPSREWYDSSFRMGETSDIRGIEVNPISARAAVIREDRLNRIAHKQPRELPLFSDSLTLRIDDFGLRHPYHNLWSKVEQYFACFTEGITYANQLFLPKSSALLYMTLLGMSDHVKRIAIKTMHVELPIIELKKNKSIQQAQKSTQSDFEETQLFQFLQMLSSVSGIDSTPVHVSVDHFTTQFSNGRFQFTHSNPTKAIKSMINRTRMRLEELSYVENNFRLDYVNLRPQPEFHFRKTLASILQKDLHAYADADNRSLVNIFRYHDHRKSILFELSNGQKILFLTTFNLDSPNDIDLALVVTDNSTIELIEAMLYEKIPRNHVITSPNGWTIYQDGSIDLNPKEPVFSSPILSRVHEIITNNDTQSITWCSQFLPDDDDLKILQERIEHNELRSVTILAPDPHYWSIFYRLTGAKQSFQRATYLARKYPDIFKLRFSSDNYLHAKFIYSEDADGNPRVLIGSHNFNRQLVRSRTTEAAVEFLLTEADHSFYTVYKDILEQTYRYTST